MTQTNETTEIIIEEIPQEKKSKQEGKKKEEKPESKTLKIPSRWTDRMVNPRSEFETVLWERLRYAR